MKAPGIILRFSGQGIKCVIYVLTYFISSCFIGLEKNNDCARRNYFSSNHLDPPKEILYKREKRPYNKKDKDYWQHKISSKRAHLMTEVEVQEAED
uniref:Uncharacterized protein n=1 Tax=Amphimedon queenslandica TaxID=400682 RepID=A0A1X7UZ80_AMPQE